MTHSITKTKVEDTADNPKTVSEPKAAGEKKEAMQIVYPGFELVDSMDVLPGAGAFREGSKVFSKILGIAKTRGSVVSVTPLSGVYNPQVRDCVIGEVTDVGFSNWSVDIGGPYDSVMSTNDVREFVERNGDLTKYYQIGEVIMCVVTGVTPTKFINVGTKDPKARKLIGGLLTQITPSKVPRLIGKQGSMIGMIKDKTKCFITVGQNGRIWIKGDFESVAAKAIKKVDEWSTQSGLTDKIEALLDNEIKKLPKKSQGDINE
ncbi:MAG: RNA-binding protein [Candidatus Aenigmarchaeota archaeon]|nr:RNA-binding protein [Candidatus Aenigmarchaeota archaeon]